MHQIIDLLLAENKKLDFGQIKSKILVIIVIETYGTYSFINEIT